MALIRNVLLAQDINKNHDPKNGEFASGSGGSKAGGGSPFNNTKLDLTKPANPVKPHVVMPEQAKASTGKTAHRAGGAPTYGTPEKYAGYAGKYPFAISEGAKAAAEFEGPQEADPAKEAQMSKGKRDDEEKFMQPKTKSGAENSPLAALRKHVTGSVESGESEAITEQPAEPKYKTALNSESGRKAHRSIAAAFNSGKSMKLGAYTTDGKAIYLHGNKIVEKGENGEINFTMAGWPTNTTRSSLSDFGINVSTSGGQRGGRGGKNIYNHSGGNEEIDPSKTYRARDEQPALALDPSSAAPQYKGRNLDDNPVGDCYATTPTHDAGGAVWAGRTLD